MTHVEEVKVQMNRAKQMSTETYSKNTADKLIQWIRQYASLHIDSHLADAQRCFPPHVLLDLGNQGFFGQNLERLI